MEFILFEAYCLEMVLKSQNPSVCPSGNFWFSDTVGFRTEFFHWDIREKTSVLISFLIKQKKQVIKIKILKYQICIKCIPSRVKDYFLVKYFYEIIMTLIN